VQSPHCWTSGKRYRWQQVRLTSAHHGTTVRHKGLSLPLESCFLEEAELAQCGDPFIAQQRLHFAQTPVNQITRIAPDKLTVDLAGRFQRRDDGDIARTINASMRGMSPCAVRASSCSTSIQKQAARPVS
jgi:hypothetical protein